jgi:hypothetical protein
MVRPCRQYKKGPAAAYCSCRRSLLYTRSMLRLDMVGNGLVEGCQGKGRDGGEKILKNSWSGHGRAGYFNGPAHSHIGRSMQSYDVKMGGEQDSAWHGEAACCCCLANNHREQMASQRRRWVGSPASREPGRHSCINAAATGRPLTAFRSRCLESPAREMPNGEAGRWSGIVEALALREREPTFQELARPDVGCVGVKESERLA